MTDVNVFALFLVCYYHNIFDIFAFIFLLYAIITILFAKQKLNEIKIRALPFKSSHQ